MIVEQIALNGDNKNPQVFYPRQNSHKFRILVEIIA